MENQHRKIDGYRDLTAEEITFMNRIKAQGVQLNELLIEASGKLQTQYSTACFNNKAELDRLHRANPTKWLHMAETNFQLGLMALVRAIAQPNSF